MSNINSSKDILEKIAETQKVLSKSEVCSAFVEKLSELAGRIEKKEILISVFGQFKRGKSTLINSILREDILPVGIIPVTSVITKIFYGNKSAAVYLEDSEEPLKIDFQELPNYVNEQNNPENIKKVISVEISTQAEFLKDGITLVDTPGVGSIHKNNTEAANLFINQSDAVIFLLSVDSPINEIERDFLIEVKNFNRKIYFAVNKIDLISNEDLNEFLKYIDSTLKNIFSSEGEEVTNNIKIFPVSALNHDDSGLKKLISSIMEDVSKEGERIISDSAEIKLAQIIDDSLHLLRAKEKLMLTPLENIFKSRKMLEGEMLNLSKISSEADYMIDLGFDETIKKIEKHLSSRKDDLKENMSKKLESIYSSNQDMNPKELEEIFLKFIRTEAKNEIAEINNEGNRILEEEYEIISSRYSEKLRVTQSFLQEKAKELFLIEYPFSTGEFLLSDRSDYYVRVNDSFGSYIFSKNDLIALLPRKKRNLKLFEKYQLKLDEDISKNITSMISDYRYKLRETKRKFISEYSRQVEGLTHNFNEFVEKTVAEKNSIQEQQKMFLDTIREQIDLLSVDKVRQ